MLGGVLVRSENLVICLTYAEIVLGERFRLFMCSEKSCISPGHSTGFGAPFLYLATMSSGEKNLLPCLRSRNISVNSARILCSSSFTILSFADCVEGFHFLGEVKSPVENGVDWILLRVMRQLIGHSPFALIRLLRIMNRIFMEEIGAE